MNKSVWKRTAAGIFSAAMLVTALTACGGSANASAEADAKQDDTAANTAAAETITVAVPGTPKPYNYVDDNGNLGGYEIDMLNAMADKAGVTLDFQITEFESMFAGLDSARYDMIIGNISKKPEREEKYLFSTKPYFKNKIVLITAPNNTDIKTIDDLGGKKVPAGAGRANAQFMESYNAEHTDNPIDIQYTDADASAALIDLYNGRYDACIYNQTYVANVTEEYGYEFNTYEIPNADEIEIPEAWILYRQDETALRDKMDEALAAIKEDGTLSKLSEQYFGEDYVPQD